MDFQKPAEEAPTPTRPAGARRAPLVVGALVLLGGAGAAWYLTRGQQPAPTAAPAPVAQAPAPEAPVGPALSTAESDALLRQKLMHLSGEPEWALWMGEQDLLRRFTGVVMAVAEGESPRALLGFMAPRGRFQVVEKGGRTTIAPASYARYDFLGRVMGSLDAQALAGVYREVKPLVDRIWREGGPPGTRFEDTLTRAFERVLAVPLPEGPVAVVEKGAVWAYADPALEGRPAADKHLMRLGPDNLRRLQDKVREVAVAMEVTLTQR